MGSFKRGLAGLAIAGLLLGLTASVAAAADDPCLGIDANGDGEVDQSPPTSSNCLIVPFAVEPEKNNTVDLDFINTHAAILWTPAFDPARVADTPLCFGDADQPANRSCVPVTGRGKFRDVNGDGKKDHIWKWSANQTGIQHGDRSACIQGQTTDGYKIEACDSMTILGDPTAAFSVNDVSVAEGDAGTATATFTVALSASLGSQTSVSYATANGSAESPGDYEPTSGQLTFASGETTKTVPVTVNGDTDLEPDETFTLQLSNASGAPISDGTGVGTIVSDDVVSTASINDATVNEGNSGTVNATFTVTISPPPSQPVAVSWTTNDGSASSPSDFAAANGVLNFGAGEATQTLDVTVNGDTSPEPTEAFSVTISSGDVAVGDGTGAGTIVNDDTLPTIAISDVSIVEGNAGTTMANFVVTLSGPSGGTVTLSYATADNTAKQPGDYTATNGILSFAPGEVSKVIPVPIVGDHTTERDEFFFVNLSNPSGATIADAQGKCTIVNDEGA